MEDAAAKAQNGKPVKRPAKPTNASRFMKRLIKLEAFKANCSEWIKVMEISLLIVPGSVEDERIFSLMKLIKSYLRNTLVNPHLSAAVRVFASTLFSVSSFPYAEAIVNWTEQKKRRMTGREM